MECLMDNAKMLVFGLDTHGRINFVNPHFLTRYRFYRRRDHRSAAGGHRSRTGKGGVGQTDSKSPEKGDLPVSTQRALVTKNGLREMSTGRMCCCATLTER
jgi:hypothetical protein